MTRITHHASRITPDFVIVGNVARDVVPGGWTSGGTAVYAAAVARGLGRRVGVVTAAPADVVQAGLPADVAVARADVGEATSFENVYTPEGRVQYLRAAGSPIPPAIVPDAWRAAKVTLLGPVYHEIGAELAARFTGRIGVCGQGFLRQTTADERVTLMPPRQWDALPLLRHADVLFLSEEDLVGDATGVVPAAWLAAAPVTVLTEGWHGARIHAAGEWQRAPALPATEVDPTGAGDSFAAAFMVARDDGLTPLEAARFAAAAAAFAVETRGPAAPSRAEIEFKVQGSRFKAPNHSCRSVG